MDIPRFWKNDGDCRDFTDRTVDTEKLKNNFCPWGCLRTNSILTMRSRPSAEDCLGEREEVYRVYRRVSECLFLP